MTGKQRTQFKARQSMSNKLDRMNYSAHGTTIHGIKVVRLSDNSFTIAGTHLNYAQALDVLLSQRPKVKRCVQSFCVCSQHPTDPRNLWQSGD